MKHKYKNGIVEAFSWTWYCIIMMGLLIFCVYVSCSGGFWTADED